MTQIKAPRLRVAVLLPDAHAPYAGRGDENFEYAGAEASDETILQAVEQAGFEVIPALVHLGNIETVVARLDCDAVLNLCDGTGAGGDGVPGVEVIAALERRRIPYTGARAEAYLVSCDKAAMLERFDAAGVPVPRWQLLRRPDEPLRLDLLKRFPLIVKPRNASGGAGIRLSSIVETEAALREQLDSLHATYGDAIVEEYVDGRELTVGIVGSGSSLKVFPPLEVRFGPAFPASRGIRTFDSKWDVDSPLYGASELLCPAPIRPAERRRVLAAARGAYRAIGGSGYGRVDLRLDERGPFVLEVNPNCCLEWSPTLADCAMFPITAQAAGLSFPALLRELVEQALRARGPAARGGRKTVELFPAASRSVKRAAAMGSRAR